MHTNDNCVGMFNAKKNYSTDNKSYNRKNNGYDINDSFGTQGHGTM
jgi:hypothetical protein